MISLARLLTTFKQYLTINIAPRWPYNLWNNTTISKSNNGKMNFRIWYRVYNRFHYLSQYDYILRHYLFTCSTCLIVSDGFESFVHLWFYYVLELYYLIVTLFLVIGSLLSDPCYLFRYSFVFWSWIYLILDTYVWHIWSMLYIFHLYSVFWSWIYLEYI